MIATSYFVGLLLDNTKFENLFLNLNKYININNIQDTVLLQNKSSLHITLYYFKEDLDENEKNNIKADIKNINENLSSIKICLINYFFIKNKKILCYLECSNKEKLKAINNYFSKKYMHSDVPENSYSFVPHVSLFKIKNNEIFEQHQQNIEQIITKELRLINNSRLFESINLFMVNSQTEPEIQIPI